MPLFCAIEKYKILLFCAIEEYKFGMFWFMTDKLVIVNEKFKEPMYNRIRHSVV